MSSRSAIMIIWYLWPNTDSQKSETYFHAVHCSFQIFVQFNVGLCADEVSSLVSNFLVDIKKSWVDRFGGCW